MGHLSVDEPRTQWPPGSPRDRSFDPWRPGRLWGVLRWLTLGLIGLCLVVGPLVGERESSYAALESGLRSGDVTAVRVESVLTRSDGTLGEPGQGSTGHRLIWRDGWQQRFTTVRQETSDALDPTSSGPRIEGPVDDALRQISPDVRLTFVQPRSAWSTIGEYVVPPLWGFLPLTAGLLWLAVLGNGPEPRLATRWAWFWLAFSPAVLAVAPAYLILGAQGATPGARRLTGGWAFLISILFLGGIGFAAG